MQNKPCCFFDVDGTFFRKQLSHEFIEAMIHEGLLPRVVLSIVEEKRRAYAHRSGSWEAYDREYIDAYYGKKRIKGVSVSDAQFVARKVIERHGHVLHVFTKELLEAAKECGFKTAAISGSPDVVVEAFAQTNGIDYWLGTEFPQENGLYTGADSPNWLFDKGKDVRKIAEAHRLDLGSSIAVGDARSDTDMLEIVGYPVCFNPSAELYGINLARVRPWPVVVERRIVYVDHFQAPMRQRAVLNDILPHPLADNLQKRLEQRGVST